MRGLSLDFLLMACGAVFGACVFVYAVTVRDVVVFFYTVNLVQTPWRWLGIAYIAAGALLFLLLGTWLRWGRPELSRGELLLAALPVVGMAPLPFLTPSFPALLCFILLSALLAFRLLLLAGEGRLIPRPPPPPWIDHLLLGGAVLALVVYAAFFQLHAMNAGRLGYVDWGAYVEEAQNTLSGKWFHSSLLNRCFLGNHFNPGAVLVLLPFVALKSHLAIFLLNAFVLYAGVFFLHRLAMEKKLGRTLSLAVALAYLLHPALSNMTYAMNYGFHTIYFTMPLIGLFFLFYERGRRGAAIAVFLFSLTINETVGFFWAGTALGFLLYHRRAWRFWVSICAGSLLYSITLVTQVIPAISGGPSYDFVCLYNNLGGTPLAVALSPLLRPLVFLKTLFRPENTLYLWMLVMPVVWLVAARPLLLLTGGLIMVFVLIRDSNRLTVIPLQYHSEFLMYLYIVSLYGAEHLLMSGAPCVYRLLRWPFDLGRSTTGRLAGAAALSALLTSAVCFNVFSLAPWSKNSMSLIVCLPACSAELEDFERLIPDKADVTASPFLAGRYIFKYNMYANLNRDCDYVFLDLCEPYMPSAELESLRSWLLHSNQHKLTLCKTIHDHRILLYVRGRPDIEDLTPPKPPLIPDEEWKSIGIPSLTWTARDVSCRIVTEWIQVENRNCVRLLFRLEREMDHDVDIKLLFASANGQSFPMSFPFGDGFWPAFMLEKGSVYQVNLSLPLHAELKVEVERKPVPRPATFQ